MIRRTQRATRTDTHCPYTTLFRSLAARAGARDNFVAILAEPPVLVALHVKARIEIERAATAIELRAQAPVLARDQVDAVALYRLHPHDVAHRDAFRRLFLFPHDRRLANARRGGGRRSGRAHV